MPRCLRALVTIVCLATPFGLRAAPAPPAAATLGERILPFSISPVCVPEPSDTIELTKALGHFRDSGDLEALSDFDLFLRAHPDSAWSPGLRSALGVIDRQNGYLSRALDRFEVAWRQLRGSSIPRVKAMGDITLGNLAELNAALGRTNRLRELLHEVEGRRLGGYASEQVSAARAGLAMMESDPGGSFRCGPLAVEQVSRVERPGKAVDPAILAYRSTATGTSLLELNRLAKRAGLDLSAVHRESGDFVVPSVLHWKAGHFAALVAENAGRYRVKDLTFGDDRWISREALVAETSGFMLVPRSASRGGFRRVSDAEAATVRGQGATGNPNPGATTPGDPKRPASPGCGGGKGMPEYDFHIAIVSLNVTDTPVGYSPPRGLAMNFGITYNSREAYQPADFNFSNLGPRWSFDWLSYVEDQDPAHAGQSVRIAELGGGSYRFTAASDGTYSVNSAGDHERLSMSTGAGGAVTFARDYPDGSRAVYSGSDGAATLRKYFLTSISDPAGNSVTLTYDSSARLVALTDALGQSTKIAYSDPAHPFRITGIYDPFGRAAAFGYDANGMLAASTDAVGMTSTFSYGSTSTSPHAPPDFMSSMTTPYGTTVFDMDEYLPGGGVPGTTRWIQSTDPMGESERVEFIQAAFGVSSTTTDPVPAGMTNGLLAYRNSFYWSPSAMASYDPADPDRYKKATTVVHWLHDNTGSQLLASSVPESIQNLGERRVWFLYPGQSGSTYIGSINAPSTVARVLDSGEEQRHTLEYTAQGKPTRYLDPVGRSYSFTYSPDGLDLLSLRNDSAGGEVLASVTYDSRHLPTSLTDYAGKTYSVTYNTFGQPTTVSFPDGTGMNYTYDAQGFLTRASRPGTNFQETYSYDSTNRLGSWTSTDGLTLTFAYDALDRIVSLTYPDGTSESTLYDRLDVAEQHDRAGRVTRYEYDTRGRYAAAIDPAGNATRFSWCGCGQIESMEDAGGHRIDWIYDAQGRRIARFSNGQLTSDYQYDSAGRLVATSDASNQTKNFAYNPDDTYASIVYANTVHSTPAVRWSWDPNHRRVVTMTDGTGITSYEYVPAGSPGAGSLASIVLPVPSHTITFTYDSLGRLTKRSVDGAAISTAYDAQGRPTQVTSPLGTATMTFDGSSSRPLSASFSGGLKTTFGYSAAAQKFAPASIVSLWAGQSAVPDWGFAFSWDASGDQPLYSNAFGLHTNYQYDAVRQLVSTTQYADALPPGPAPPTTSYTYDAAGNRTSEAAGSVISTATYDDENRLVTIHRGLSRQAMAALRAARARKRRLLPPRGNDIAPEGGPR